MGQDPTSFDLEAFLPYRISRLAGRVSRRLGEIYGRRHGLSIVEWRILAHLSQESEVSVRDIGRRVEMDRVRVTRATKALHAAGLVQRQVNGRDRRLVRLSLTARGRALLDELVPTVLAFERDWLAVLDREEEAVLRRTLDKLDAALARQTDPPVGGDDGG